MNTVSISSVAIRQTSDNLYSLTDLHKASGGRDTHKPNNWLRSQQAQELIAEIQAEGKTAVQTSQGGKNRGTFVCKELVYAYATWISAKFFLLVIRTFDAAVAGSLKNPKTSVAERTGLRDAVNLLVSKKGLNYSEAYHMLHQRFGVDSIEDLPREVLPEAVEYVHRITLEGEVLDKKTVLPDNELKPIMSLLAKLAAYTMGYRDIQQQMIARPDQISYWFNNFKNAPEEGFLFVFKPDISRDIEAAGTMMHRYKHLIA